MASFDIAVEKTLAYEGGYVNDPKDPGGETNFGISKRSYPNVDVKNLTKAQAKEIYRRDFWNAVQGDAVKNQAAANSVFDMAVNAGPGTAKKMANKAASISGKASYLDLNELQGGAFNTIFGKLRIAYYRALAAKRPSSAKFLKGWEKRAKGFFQSNAKGAALAVGVMMAAGAAVYIWKRRKEKQGA